MKFKSLVGICLLLLCYSCLNAQENFYVSKMDSMFLNLDKSAVTSGILLNRIYPFYDITSFNPSTDTTENSILEQTYFELYYSAYSKNPFLSLRDFSDLIDVERINGRAPISVIDYGMHYLRSTAIDENLISYRNEMFYDVAGRTNSPYNYQRVQIAAPMVDSAQVGWVKFSLPDVLCLTNNNVTVSSVVLTFPQKTINLSQNGADSVYFSTTGKQTGNITVYYTNGQQFSQKTAIYIVNSSSGSGMPGGRIAGPPPIETDPCYSEAARSDITFQGYDETTTYYAWNTVNYYYRTNAGFDCNVKIQRSLNKPIIVIDGFDPTNKRKAETIKKEGFFYIDPSGATRDLGEELRGQGYDIIIVNHPNYIEGTKTIQTPLGPKTVSRFIRGGGDYIERNAMVLIKIIQDINQQLASQGSTEKIVIVGPSMGGQIARVALKYMEDHGMNHNCRLWISMDSPHEGAILPIGVQGMSKALGALFYKAWFSLEYQINCSAAKQMLIHHHLANSEAPVGAPGFFDRYYQYVNGVNGQGGLGFPHASGLRRIAGNSGARNGLLQDGFTCNPIFSISSGNPNNNLFKRFFLGGPTYSISEVSLSPSNLQGRCQVAHVDFTFMGSTKIFYNLFASQNSGLYNASLEMLPGGYYPGFQEIADSLRSTNQVIFKSIYDILAWLNKIVLGKYPTATMPYPNHAHELTGSTLGYGLGPRPNPNRKWDDNTSGIDLVCAGEIPFDSYFGPLNFNTRHDLLFYDQAMWFKDEVNKKNRTPNLATTPYSIQRTAGNEPICTSTATFTVSNPPLGGTITWSSPSTNINFSPTTGTSTTVSRISNGTATLIATITNACSPTTTATYYVRVGGYGSSDYQVSGPSNAGCNSYVTYTCPSLPEATNYNWFYPSSWSYSDGQGTNMLTLITGSISESGQVGVRVANACDAGGSPSIISTFVNGGCSFAPMSFQVSPNPAASSINISPSKNAKAANHSTFTEINIYDETIGLKKHKIFNKVNHAIIDISDLSAGTYIVEIIDGAFKERQKLQIVR